ncbi:hypothetical protein LJC61_00330 [Ruminococcaceae bacterium OttesenSCG-928-A16]|nr:hypothetical protein [Ruminococcaceae bacterium OttesenSCG-928-A16]
MLRKITSVMLLFIVLLTAFSTPAFAATTDAPGLVSERIESDGNGNEVIIRVYKLDENGNLPIPQTRASRLLYNNGTWVSTGGYSTLVSRQAVQGLYKEAVSCYNDGTGALTFYCNYASVSEQAVSPGYAVQFIIQWSGSRPMYDVGVKANWSAHQTWIRIYAG